MYRDHGNIDRSCLLHELCGAHKARKMVEAYLDLLDVQSVHEGTDFLRAFLSEYCQGDSAEHDAALEGMAGAGRNCFCGVFYHHGLRAILDRVGLLLDD